MKNIAALLVVVCSGCGGDPSDPSEPDGPAGDPVPITVHPTEITDLLLNPGIGMANFSSNTPPPPEYPAGSVYYRRWTWADMEPTAGNYNFAKVDDAIAQAQAKGMTLAFRIMPHWQASTPQWLLDMGVDSVGAADGVTDGIFPDHNDPVFLDRMERMVRAFGERYSGSPDVDHVDIGSVGCFGEWHWSCCDDRRDDPNDNDPLWNTCRGYFPNDANRKQIVDWYVEAFPDTPLVALVAEEMHYPSTKAYAASKGAGWRGDCFGDYKPTGWNHMVNTYLPAAEHPITGQAWQTAPVEFEICWQFSTWVEKGYTDAHIDYILQKGLDWHMSVLNGKSRPVPVQWRAKFDDFLKKAGYRLVLTELTHPTDVARGGSLAVSSRWENKGVAPIYHPWPLAYRLRGPANDVALQWTSAADLETWLPGAHDVADAVTVPLDGVAPGTYTLDVAILTDIEDAGGAAVNINLAIDGKLDDGWYPVSQVTVR